MMLEKLLKENIDLALVMLETSVDGLLPNYKRMLVSIGLENIYDFTKRDIVKGNFSVMYIDSRLITKEREKIVKQINKMRERCIIAYNNGTSLSKILMEYYF